ncbi:hypothetical protein [Clostridium tyrobutyricum]
MLLDRLGVRKMEAFILCLIAIIVISFLYKNNYFKT